MLLRRSQCRGTLFFGWAGGGVWYVGTLLGHDVRRPQEPGSLQRLLDYLRLPSFLGLQRPRAQAKVHGDDSAFGEHCPRSCCSFPLFWCAVVVRYRLSVTDQLATASHSYKRRSRPETAWEAIVRRWATTTTTTKPIHSQDIACRLRLSEQSKQAPRRNMLPCLRQRRCRLSVGFEWLHDTKKDSVHSECIVDISQAPFVPQSPIQFARLPSCQSWNSHFSVPEIGGLRLWMCSAQHQKTDPTMAMAMTLAERGT